MKYVVQKTDMMSQLCVNFIPFEQILHKNLTVIPCIKTFQYKFTKYVFIITSFLMTHVGGHHFSKCLVLWCHLFYNCSMFLDYSHLARLLPLGPLVVTPATFCTSVEWVRYLGRYGVIAGRQWAYISSLLLKQDNLKWDLWVCRSALRSVQLVSYLKMYRTSLQQDRKNLC
jgi:hypothetical protein